VASNISAFRQALDGFDADDLENFLVYCYAYRIAPGLTSVKEWKRLGKPSLEVKG
jgi:hypothetical protein